MEGVIVNWKSALKTPDTPLAAVYFGPVTKKLLTVVLTHSI